MRTHRAPRYFETGLAVALLTASAASSQEAPGPEPGPRLPGDVSDTTAPAGRARSRRRPAREHRLRTPQLMNVIDEAVYTLAEHYIASSRLADAVRLLDDLAAVTPDAETRSVTCFNLGVIHGEKLHDEAKARAYFSKVTGRLAATARHSILTPLRRQKNWAESVEFLKECLANAHAPGDRADVVRQLIRLARSCGDAKLMESVLSSVPDMITYEDAQKDVELRRATMEEARRRQAERRREEAARRGRRTSRVPESPWRRAGRPRTIEPPPPVGRGEAREQGVTRDEPPPPEL